MEGEERRKGGERTAEVMRGGERREKERGDEEGGERRGEGDSKRVGKEDKGEGEKRGRGGGEQSKRKGRVNTSTPSSDLLLHISL